jgi:hypothetical protein
MAIQYWSDMSILVGSQEVSGTAKAFNLSTEVAALDATPLSTTGWVELIGGLKSGSVDLELMSEMTEDGQDAAAWSYLGTADIPHSIVTNSADGSVAYTFRGLPLSFTPFEGNVGDIAMTRISGASSTSPVVRGQLIHPTSTDRTSSGTGTGQQHGAVASGKSLYAALHVVSASGSSPTLDVIVQSDDNGSFTTPTNRITFTQAAEASHQWSSVAGAITDDYWRVTFTIGGGSPSFNFAVVIGIV